MRKLLPILCILFAACSSGPEIKAASANTAPAGDVHKMYQDAMADFKDSLYPEAIKGFEEIKNRHPYSEYAALADVRIGDAYFKQEKYAEAVDAYRTFLRYHPEHSEAAYGSYQIAESYWKQIPNNWWFMPPTAEKDSQNTTLAITAFNEVATLYPQSKYATMARERMNISKRKVADHEMYVAKFYFKRKAWKAAALRAEGLLQEFPQTPQAGAAKDLLKRAK
jgi:outer membrane protein assembly factor BamD